MIVQIENPIIIHFHCNFVISDLEIVEVSGRIILTKNILDNPEEKISVKEFPSGIYFISLKTVSGVKFLYKVVKE
mgnify:CR=1 FL=1